jgi:hypothetical protein
LVRTLVEADVSTRDIRVLRPTGVQLCSRRYKQ